MKNILIIGSNGSLKTELENTSFFGEVKNSLSFKGSKIGIVDILIVDGAAISYDKYLNNFSNFLKQVKSNYYIARDLDTYSTVNKNLSSYGIIVIPPLLTDKQISQKICSLAIEDFAVKNNTVCFFGAGSGVGTEMISQSVAQVVSELTDKSVIFLSLDGSEGTSYLDLDSTSYGIWQIKDRLINNILSTEELKNSCLKTGPLYVLPGESSISKLRHYHPGHIEKLICLSSKTFDITIINGGSSISGMSIGALNSSKLKYLVTTQRYKYYKNFLKLQEQVFVNLGINAGDFSLILNKYIENNNFYDGIDISKNYGMQLASVIPLLDYTLGLEAENKKKTLVGYDNIFSSSIEQLSFFLCRELGIEIKDKKAVRKSFFKRIMRKG